MHIHRETEVGAEDLADAILDLRTSALGGYADVIEHIAFTSSGKFSGFAALTETELRVLRLLDSGATSRQIAASTSRSSLTIDTHVKAIARKLNCKGRREAVAVARSRGIL
jgi:DNA-binding NarL/FixJ family response regulator